MKKTSSSPQAINIVGTNGQTYNLNNLLLTCSSYAFNPVCSYRKVSDDIFIKPELNYFFTQTSDLMLVNSYSSNGYVPLDFGRPLTALLIGK